MEEREQRKKMEKRENIGISRREKGKGERGF